METLNSQKISDNEEEIHRKRQIIAEALATNEFKHKRFIYISLLNLRIFGSQAELEERTEEIFQQTAKVALQKAKNFDANRSAYSWLNGFAANEIKQMQRCVLGKREKFEDGFEDFERIERLRRKIETTPLPDETFWEKSERDEDERIRFGQLISKLKNDYQKILWLHYFDELNIIEIAAQLGKSEGAAQRQLNRAEQRLGEILRGNGREKK